MSAISQSVQDATVALRDAADAAASLGRAANALSDALKSVADLEARVAVLEHAITSLEAVAARVGRICAASESMAHAEMHSHVDTKTAAGLLCRSPQTLRKWACYEDGPLRPARVNGRLAWAVADIDRLLSSGKS
jgi:uncharacterized small protein (DUF1192 family)